jgi:hypothetical protein
MQLLTLYITPVIYLYLDRFDRRIAKAIGEDEPELKPKPGPFGRGGEIALFNILRGRSNLVVCNLLILQNLFWGLWAAGLVVKFAS